MIIGIVASSNGGVFSSVASTFSKYYGDISFRVITDRACGIEEYCQRKSIEHIRIEENDNVLFSKRAQIYFAANKVDFVVLFFVRLVTSDLFKKLPVFNLHPSLLPAFTGFNPEKQALLHNVRYIGATAHIVDESVDGGPIIAQTVMPLKPRCELEYAMKHTYLQKCYLFLLLIDMCQKKLFTGDISQLHDVVAGAYVKGIDRANPCIEDSRLVDVFKEIENREGYMFISRDDV